MNTKATGFSQFINESDVEFDDTPETTETTEDTPTNETPGEEEGSEGPQPEIIKVYSDSEEDLQELADAGIELEDGMLPEDAFYIKIKTLEGTEEILLFVERNPENRIPVTDDSEGSEESEDEDAVPAAADEAETPVTESKDPTVTDDMPAEDAAPVTDEEGAEAPTEDVPTGGRFDTELVAQHGDNEYVIAAEIEVATDGEVEDVDVQEDEPVEVQDPTEEGTEGDDMPPAEEEEESPVTESCKVKGFEEFIKG